MHIQKAHMFPEGHIYKTMSKKLLKENIKPFALQIVH